MEGMETSVNISPFLVEVTGTPLLGMYDVIIRH